MNGRPGIRDVIVGNETLHRGALDIDALTQRLAAARALTDVAISTAEPWHVRLEHPALAAHVDFITVHVLPYWEGVSVQAAPAYVEMRLGEGQGNARVLRMDDIGDAGNYHGFHVITLYENGDRETEWFALPR